MILFLNDAITDAQCIIHCEFLVHQCLPLFQWSFQLDGMLFNDSDTESEFCDGLSAKTSKFKNRTI